MEHQPVSAPRQLQLVTQQQQQQQRPIEVAQEDVQIHLREMHASTAAYMRGAIYNIQMFTGEPGELRNFIALADFHADKIDERASDGQITVLEAVELKVAIVSRIKQRVLARIRAGPLEDWPSVRHKLRAHFGGGHRSIEEDTLALFRMTRKINQTEEQFAEEVLECWEKLNLKMAENLTQVEIKMRLRFSEPLLKLVLRPEEDDGPAPETCHFAGTARRTREREERPKERRWKSWPKEDRVKAKQKREKRPGRHEGIDPERRTPDKRVLERKRTPRRRKTGEERKNVQCFKCDRTGHMSYQCPTTRCFECRKRGHQSKRCPLTHRRYTENRAAGDSDSDDDFSEAPSDRTQDSIPTAAGSSRRS